MNPQIPRTHGDSFIHVDKIKYFVEADVPLKELPQVGKEISSDEIEVYKKIGKNIADIIEDGATLQMGIGSIPDAVLSFGNKNISAFIGNVFRRVSGRRSNYREKTLHPEKLFLCTRNAPCL